MIPLARLRWGAFIALLLAAFTLPGLSAVAPARSAATTALQLPLRFERNQGQTAARVQYLARGQGYTLFLTRSAAVLSLQASRKATAPADVIRLQLLHANRHSRMQAMDQLPGASNYLIGRNPKNWLGHVPGYRRVAERGVYPGIDLVYYGNRGRLEYDFVVAPHADPSRIVFRVQGAAGITVGRHGNLVLSSHDGSITLRRPTIYQLRGGRRLAVTGSFVRKGRNQIAFRVGAFDHSHPLVIDPVLEYSSFLGGSNLDAAYAIALDGSGDVYLTGTTTSLDFPVQGGVQSTCGGDCDSSQTDGDVFVTKIDPKGPSLVYSTYLGGSGADWANGIAVDASGDAYLAGGTSSADFPLLHAYQSTCAACSSGQTESFVTELNPAGSSLVFSTFLGGNGTSHANAIALDSSGAIYVAGNYWGSTDAAFPMTTGSFGLGCETQTAQVRMDTITGGASYVTKLQPGAAGLVYSGCVGWEPTNIAGIAVDAAGAAYITGATAPEYFPTTSGAFQTTSAVDPAAGSVGFVAKINPAGTAFDYSTFLGGSTINVSPPDLGTRLASIAIDATGDAFVTGLTDAIDYPVKNALQSTFPGGGTVDAVVSELNPAGSGLVFSTYIGTGQGSGRSIALDPSGNIFVAIDSTDAAPVDGFYAPLPNSAVNTYIGDFLVELAPAGTAIRYATPVGYAPSVGLTTGSSGGTIHGMALDASDTVYLAGSTDGQTSSPNAFPVTGNALQSSFGGGASDAFLSIWGDTVLQPSPSLLSFPDQAVGTASAAQTITLTASGHAPATVSSITATGDFSESDNCPGSLSSGQSCTAQVVFQPAASGARSGTLSIATNTSATNLTIALSGSGLAPSATISPATLTFAPQPVYSGSASPAQTVTLHNSGAGPMTITAVTVSANYSETNTCGSSLAAGADCTISVNFSPSASGVLTGTLSVADNATNSPQTVALTGTGLTARATLSPASLNFASQPNGTTSAAQSVTLTNASNATAALAISKITVSGDFSETSNCGASLAIGASCAIQVSFTPTQVGSRSGTLTVVDDSGSGQQSVLLTGTGTGPAISFSATQLQFGSQFFGTTSAPQTLTLQNTGTLPLQISGMTASTDFSVSSGCGQSVAAGASCQITVTFTPTSLGPVSGTLTISDNAASTPPVQLSGTGIGPVLKFSATSLSFPDEPVGRVGSPLSVTLQNTGTAPLSIGNLTVTGDFILVTGCSQVDPQTSCSFMVEFAPTVSGARTGALQLTDNNPGSPQQTIQLSGTGIGATATLSMSLLSFGSETVGSVSPAQSISLNNSGSAPLQIAGISASGDFTQANTCGAQLAAAQGCSISVQFAPAAAGTRTGSLVISDSNGGATIALQGTGTQPGAVLAPGMLAFGSEAVGSVSAAQTVTLTNSGTAPLAITGITASTDFQQTNTCGSSLAAGANCILNVQFAPSATGARVGTVTVADNLGTQVVALSGSGSSAELSVSPSTLTFGTYGVNSLSPAQTVTLTNSGTAALALGGVTAEGDFSETNDCGASLAAGAQCAFNVVFQPAAGGQRTGTLLIQAGGSTGVVTLTGSGSLTGIRLSPAEVSFGSQPVGIASPPQTVTITNTGSGVLTISQIAASGDYHQTNTCGTLPAQVAAAASCQLNISVTPSTPGTITGSIQLLTSSGTVTVGAPQSAGTPAPHAASATAETDWVALSSSGSDFGLTTPQAATVSPGQSKQFSVDVNNLGSTAQKLTLTCTGAPTAGTCQVSPATMSLGSSKQTATVSVTTAAPSSVLPPGSFGPPAAGRRLLELAIPSLLLLLLLALTLPQGWDRRRLAAALAGLGLVLILAGCGGGAPSPAPTPTSPGTPAGTYTVTLTATASSGLSHSVSWKVTVN